MRQVCKVYDKKKRSISGFYNLEKAYDRIDRDSLWNVLRLYGRGGRLLNGVKSFNVNSRACVKWERV